MKQLEKELGALKETFEEVAGLIAVQGDDLGVIESHVLRADQNIEEGTVSLRKASEYQHKSRWKFCTIIGIALVILLGLIVFLVLFFIPGGLGSS
jgi:t-SNARE complex subunit (syntaxin)